MAEILAEEDVEEDSSMCNFVDAPGPRIWVWVVGSQIRQFVLTENKEKEIMQLFPEES